MRRETTSSTPLRERKPRFFVGKDVLLPVWGTATGKPSDYTITSLVGFHVLGWSGNGNNRGGDMRIVARRPAVHRRPATVGDDTKPCLYGYVTSFTSTRAARPALHASRARSKPLASSTSTANPTTPERQPHNEEQTADHRDPRSNDPGIDRHSGPRRLRAVGEGQGRWPRRPWSRSTSSTSSCPRARRPRRSRRRSRSSRSRPGSSSREPSPTSRRWAPTSPPPTSSPATSCWPPAWWQGAGGRGGQGQGPGLGHVHARAGRRRKPGEG